MGDRARGRGQVPYLVRRRQPGHGANTAQQLAGREPQLAAAYLLHAAPPPGQLVPRLAPVFPEPSALHAQPVRRVTRQKPPRSDRPRPSALADAARPRTTSASASLTWRRSIASSTRQPSNRNPPSGPLRAGGFRSPSVTPKWPILNHANTPSRTTSPLKADIGRAFRLFPPRTVWSAPPGLERAEPIEKTWPDRDPLDRTSALERQQGH
jgi:hypothetical protein